MLSCLFSELIEVRGSPLRCIFSWARWGRGPGQIPELLRRRRRRRRRRRIFLKHVKKTNP